ncbi:SPOR domain-containing protein, partial [Piscinibacter sp.]
ALKLDLLRGVAPVELERITFAEIRSGAWRRGEAAPAVAAAPAPAPPPPALDIAPVAAAPDAPPAEAPRPLELAPRGFWIQLGAFRQRDGAESFQRRVADELDWLAPRLAVFVDTPLFRLQAGPYASREEAREGAERVRDALQLVPLIVERR